MNNEDLRKWNESVEAARVSKQDALERAIRSRGLKRRGMLMFARWFGKIEAMGARWRNNAMDGE